VKAPAVSALETAVYVIPTDAPEADGTLAWDKTTLVLVTARAGDEQGLGWSYASAAAQTVITEMLADLVTGRDVLDTASIAEAMARQVRNIGRPGVAATAISAVDIALWDLKARLLGQSLAGLLGPARQDVPVYGAALAAANQLQVSGHCAPNLHAHVGAAVPNLRHVEYFHDHQRIERLFFDGALDPTGGAMRPDLDRPGHGLVLRHGDTERYRRS